LSYVNRLKALNNDSRSRITPFEKTDLITMYKIFVSSLFAVDRFSRVQLYTRSHNFRLIKQQTQ